METNDKLIITPKTKIFQLIETYPELEDILIEYAPAFKKLKNPVLRKTVGRIATIQQAAAIGNVKVEDLINRLRQEVGQDLFTAGAEHNYITKRPDWYAPEKVKTVFDIREMLESDERPVDQAVTDLQKLKKDEIYKLLAPFLPAPLIDKASSLNIDHWVDKAGDEKFIIYFIRK